MRRITTCSLAMLIVAAIHMTADATIVDIVQGNPNATAADFAQSFVAFDQCVAEGNSRQACYKIQWDPIFITEGIMTVDVTPFNGDTSRIGRVLQVTFFNGYTGNGRFERFELEDRVRFEIPVISVEDPPLLKNVNIVELQVEDRGGSQAFFDFNIGARRVKVQRDDGTIDDSPVIISKPEILGFNIELTPEQQVPDPRIGEFAPLGGASLNISNIDPKTNTANVSISGGFSGLTSSPVGVSLRGPAPPGKIAEETILELEFSEKEGSFGISDASVSITQLGHIMSGLTYLDIATERNDSGEVRGQIIPEPSSFGLLLLGLTSLVCLRRR